MKGIMITNTISVSMIILALVVLVTGGTLGVLAMPSLVVNAVVTALVIVIASLPSTLICLFLSYRRGIISLSYFLLSLLFCILSIGTWHVAVVFILRKDIKDYIRHMQLITSQAAPSE